IEVYRAICPSHLVSQRCGEVLQDRRLADAPLAVEHDAVARWITEYSTDGAQDVLAADKGAAVANRVAGDIGVLGATREVGHVRSGVWTCSRLHAPRLGWEGRSPP